MTWRTSIVRHESDSSASGKTESHAFRDWVLVAEKLQPLGQKWTDELAASYLALNDKRYLEAIATKIIDQARREHERPSAPTIDSLGRRFKNIFDAGNGIIIANLNDGRAVAIDWSEFVIYPSIEEYRIRKNDHSKWREITQTEEKRQFYMTCASVLDRLNASLG